MAALAQLGSPPPAARATLAKATRVAIETQGDARSPRSFELRSAGSATTRIRDAGSSARFVAERRTRVLADGRRQRALAGVELLSSARGSLTLRWTGVEVQRAGRWHPVAGRWSVAGAGGAYSGRMGHGRFTSDERFAVVSYRGLLFTAM
jgi:hypothetical protein